MATLLFRQRLVRIVSAGLLVNLITGGALRAQDEPKTANPASLIRSVRPNDKLEMIVKSSQILTLQQKIPTAQVNDPSVLSLTPLSPTQVQLFAKKQGMTQVNLWDERQQIHTIEVSVLPDTRQLLQLIQSEFPKASIRIRPFGGGVLISGSVDRQSDVDQIQQLAELFFETGDAQNGGANGNGGGPQGGGNNLMGQGAGQSGHGGQGAQGGQGGQSGQGSQGGQGGQNGQGGPAAAAGRSRVIMNVLVGGVQQIVLHVKVMEVSRTKLRTLGFDFAQISAGGGMFVSGASQMLRATSASAAGLSGSVSPTAAFQIVDGGSSFFGVLNALRQDNLAKLLSEPRLVTTSGRPAYFIVGGEIPYLVPQSLGTTTIDWKQYGTKIDFVPIVLGNNRLRLEIRPQVSEIDQSRAEVNGVPALKTSMVDTGVEMRVGQTLAIAGLVQRRTEALNRGLPGVSELPYVGRLFGVVRETTNEIESLVMVTPQFVEAMDPEDVPPCGPGLRTTSPNDWQLYAKGFIEVPENCPPCNDPNCPVHDRHGSHEGKPAPVFERQTQQPTEAPAPPAGASGYRTPAGETTAEEGTTPASWTAQRAGGNRYNASGPQAARRDSSRAKTPGQLPGFSGPIGYDTAE